MNDKIYNVDLSNEITPGDVRDAILLCFLRAHGEVLKVMKEYHEFESEEEFKEMENLNVSLLIKNIFKKIGADFNNPTKDDLVKVLHELSEYAANFRRPEIIKKHYDEIAALLDKLK